MRRSVLRNDVFRPFALIAALAAVNVAEGWQGVGLMPAAYAAEDKGTESWSAAELDKEGMKAIESWMGSLVKGDPDGVAAILAPEFQIMRSDGSSYDRDGYIKGGMAKIAAMPKIEKLVVTGFGDHIVTRYMLTVDETVEGGKAAESHAPRITVFRKSGDRWLVVAHGNFAKIQ
jgi:ketosteroid isomerase-like protein